MHGGARVGLGDDEQLAVTSPLLGRRAESSERRRTRRVVAQQTQTGAGHRVQHRLPGLFTEDILPVAEEGEVVGRQPVQEAHPLGDLGGIDARRGRRAQLVGDFGAVFAHLGPVLDGVADVAEQAVDLGGDALAVGRVAQPVDLDVHPRLDADPELAVWGLVDVEDLLEDTAGVPTDHQLGVDQQVHAQTSPGQRHRHGVDEEGHVVGDDLDDGSGVTPTLRLDRGVVDQDVSRPDRPLAGEVEVGQRRPKDVLWRPGQQVLGRHVSVVARQEGFDGISGTLLCQARSTAQHVAARLLKRGGHGE